MRQHLTETQAELARTKDQYFKEQKIAASRDLVQKHEQRDIENKRKMNNLSELLAQERRRACEQEKV